MKLKGVFSAISAAAVLLTAAPAAAFALDPLHTAKAGGVTYSFAISDGGAEIISVSGASGVITVPEELEGYPIVSIGENAFFGASELEFAYLPDTLENIGASAFMGCLSMTQLNIPDSVKTIGKSAFMSCNELTTVCIGSGVTELPEECFHSCPALTEAYLPDGLEKIGTEAFFGCPAAAILIPESVTEIGENALGMQYDVRTGGTVNIYGFLIGGATGSYAETYAAENGLDFLDPNNYLAGDINNDGKVEASDASAALAEYSRASTGAELLFTMRQKIVGDMNLDGAINASDASAILTEYARLSTQ